MTGVGIWNAFCVTAAVGVAGAFVYMWTTLPPECAAVYPTAADEELTLEQTERLWEFLHDAVGDGSDDPDDGAA